MQYLYEFMNHLIVRKRNSQIYGDFFFLPKYIHISFKKSYPLNDTYFSNIYERFVERIYRSLKLDINRCCLLKTTQEYKLSKTIIHD